MSRVRRHPALMAPLALDSGRVLHLHVPGDIEISERRRPITELGEAGSDFGGLAELGVGHRILVGGELHDWTYVFARSRSRVWTPRVAVRFPCVRSSH